MKEKKSVRKKVARKRAMSGTKSNGSSPVLAGYVLSARRDTVDFRDKMYVPTLIEVPPTRPLETYLERNPKILDQGREGACTGFGLAAVANYLLGSLSPNRPQESVSPRMMYEMAKRNDEWPGEDYEGSSARGAMKGWHKYGVCSESVWPYSIDDRTVDNNRLEDARNCPLGAYFRVNHKDIVAMHSALTETGILYATSLVHKGWSSVVDDGRIKYEPDVEGGHAFAIVGYDRSGFWIQNSWGTDWGRKGFGHVSYFDWLENGSDVWVARLGVPVSVGASSTFGLSTFPETLMGQGISVSELRPHVVSLGNDGLPMESGDFANTAEEIRSIVSNDFTRITRGWQKKRILLYAHGGLVGEKNAVQRVAEYRSEMLKAEVYPLAFVWHSDFWSTLKNILKDAVASRRSEGFFDRAKDFMLDRLDDTLEPIARYLGGKAQWSEMKENALAATEGSKGGARLVVEELEKLVKLDSDIEIHVVGHSAGSIFLGPLVQEISRFASIATCHLWAPACTVDFFKKRYLPLLKGRSRKIRNFALYTLNDSIERDDHCANIYHKSLLYLVARSFEEEYRPLKWGWPGAPILGMERFIKADREVAGLFSNLTSTWVLSPNSESDPLLASGSTSHGGFDDDDATIKGTLTRVIGQSSQISEDLKFAMSADKTKDQRYALQN